MNSKAAWILANSALVIAWYFAEYHGVQWLGVAVVIFIWLMLLVYTYTLFERSLREKTLKRTRAVPDWIGYVFDVTFLLLLIHGGWYLSAIAYVSSCAVLYQVYNGKGVSFPSAS